VELNPENVAATYNLGIITLAQDAPAEALRRFETAARTAPSDIPVLIGMLESQLLLHKTSDAHDTAGRIAVLVKDNDPRVFQIAALLAQHGESAAAIPLMERARQAFPQSYDVNYNLALACFQTARYTQAAAVLRPFTGPQGKAEASDLLGAIEEKRGHIDDAEHAFEEAAQREPVNEDYRFDWGNALLQHGKLEMAVQVLRRAVSDMPKSWRLRIGLGSANYLAGDYEGSAETLLEAIRLQPDAMIAYFLLGEAYDSAGRFRPAIETALTSYLKAGPRDPGPTIIWALSHTRVPSTTAR
jgi:tetratricopeptide (TPR) repeat protein